MLTDGVEKELKRFTDYVVKEARTNLTRLKKNSTKSLYDSLKGNVKVSSNSFEMSIEMEEYGHFQDKGVNGLKKNHNAPYSFKKGFPNRQMINSLDKWIMRKGIAPRGKDGKFISRTSLKFAIAKSIFNKGIKPSLFLTKPFEKAFKTLPDELIEKFGLEVLDLFKYTIQTPKK
jgi:hypothetical protein